MVQVPVSSVNSAAADVETYVMRQSPRISDQLVTLNSRTFLVADNTLTPATVQCRCPSLICRSIPHPMCRDSRLLRQSTFCSKRMCTAEIAAALSSLFCGWTGACRPATLAPCVAVTRCRLLEQIAPDTAKASQPNAVPSARATSTPACAFDADVLFEERRSTNECMALLHM